MNLKEGGHQYTTTTTTQRGEHKQHEPHYYSDYQNGNWGNATHSALPATSAAAATANIQGSHYLSNSEMDSYGNTPMVPVASAPKNETLYDSLLRYHNEHDDDDDDDDDDDHIINHQRRHHHDTDSTSEESDMAFQARRRRRAAAAGTSSTNPLKQPPQRMDSLEDRKLPARPSNQLKSPPPPQSQKAVTSTLKQPPLSASPLPIPATTPPTAQNHELDPDLITLPESAGSFYRAAFEESQQRQQQQQQNVGVRRPASPMDMIQTSLSSSPTSTKRPGIVQVHEPAIRPNSAMYRAAYGDPSPLNQQTHPTNRSFPTNQHVAGNGGGREHFVPLTTTNSGRPQLSHSRSDERLNHSNHSTSTQDSNSSNSKFGALSGGTRFGVRAPPRNRSTDGVIGRRRNSLVTPQGQQKRQGRVAQYHPKPMDMEGGNASSHHTPLSGGMIPEPPAHMMHIGDDEHMGFGGVKGKRGIGPRLGKSKQRGSSNSPPQGSGHNHTNANIPGSGATVTPADMMPTFSHGPAPARMAMEPPPAPTSLYPSPKQLQGYKHAGPKQAPYSQGYGAAMNHLNASSTHSAPLWRGGAESRNSGTSSARLSDMGGNSMHSTSTFGGSHGFGKSNATPRNSSSSSSASQPRTSTTFDPRRRSPEIPGSVLPPDLRHLAVPPPSASIVSTDSSMDEDLRLALEISKQDTGRSSHSPSPPHGRAQKQAPAPTSNAPAAKPRMGLSERSNSLTPAEIFQRQHSPEMGRNNNNNSNTLGVPKPPGGIPFQSSFGREAFAHAEQHQNSSLADLMLALKLSAEESAPTSGGGGGGGSGHRSTNLDELLAFEMTQDSTQNMTDFVAAGISTNDQHYQQHQKHQLQQEPFCNSPTSNSNEQLRILNKIREEQEQKELELALKASQAESEKIMGGDVSGGRNHSKPPPPSSTLNMMTNDNDHHHHNHQIHNTRRPPDFLQSQQKAMEEWSSSRWSRGGTGERPGTQRQNSSSSFDSEGRRRELLERGTSETKQAIRSGQAHVVSCRGCGGRLQAPVSYSLVFCPKCQTISPA